MKENGEGMTEKDLRDLPEVDNVVLWQNDDGPTMVTDSGGKSWFIGMYNGRLCKSRIF